MMLSEAEKHKAVSQFKLQMNVVLSPFNMHGLDIFITGAIEETADLALLLHKRLNGQDIPITAELAKAKNKARRKK